MESDINAFNVINGRLSRLRALMQKRSLDAFLLFVNEHDNTESCRYVSGFTGNNAALLIDHKRAILISDGQSQDQARQQSPFEFILYPRAPEKEAVRIAEESRCRKVGFEAEKISHHAYKKFLANHPLRWEDSSQLIPALRRKKDPGEICCISKAGTIAFDAYEAVVKQAHEGMSEREFANMLLYTIKQMGADNGWGQDDFVVVSGERGVLPHGSPTDKKFQSGNIVTVDFGAMVNGYFSDITRNFCIGNPSQRASDIHAILTDAHRKAAAALAPGKSCKEIDNTARQIIVASGYGKNFSHGLGHGMGLRLHESPRLSPLSDDILQSGDVVTIEPGIYIEGWGGMRIEDDYLITAEGAVCLTRSDDQVLKII